MTRRRKTPPAAAGYVPIGPAAAARPFDPAAWLAEAEHLGYGVYLVPSERSASGYGLMTENPMPREHSAADDLWLWRWLQPNEATYAVNRAALREHMLAIGRVLLPTKGGANDKS